MKHISVRLRYLAGYLLVLVPILLFSLALYFSTVERSTQYISTASLQQFSYAAENLSAIFNRLAASADSAFALEETLVYDEQGRLQVQSEDRLCDTLRAMAERLSPQVDLMLYMRGDSYLYTPDGRIPYSVWESRYQDQYSLPLSQFYYNLMSLREPTLLPLLPSDESAGHGGLAYITPFPVDAAQPSALLIYLLDSSIIADEFANYLGSIPGDLYLYNSRYTQLFAYTAGDSPLMAYDEIIKVRGVGLQRVESADGKKLVLLKTPDSQLDLHCALLAEEDVLYSDLRGTQHLMLVLILALVVIIFVLALWTTFFNYKPIGDLVAHITGADPYDFRSQDELSLIRSAYDQRTTETERLTTYLLELQPVVAQQLVRKLIAGKIASREEFLQLARNADIPFTRPYNAALCLPAPQDAQILDLCLQRITRFQPARCTVCWGELMTENVLCVIINFADEPGESPADTSCRLAAQLSEHLSEGFPLALRVGVGRTYEDPLLLPESFAEARTAIQLAPHGPQRIFLYDPRSSAEGSVDLHALADTPAMGLLTEGIRRGEKNVALHAFEDVMQMILAGTESFSYFRFCSSEVLTQILHQARSLGLAVDQKQVVRLIEYKSQAEFTRNVTPFLESLCDRMRENIQQEDSLLNQRILDYILDNYKRPDLSIQAVSDDLQVPKAQITVMLRESVGQNFVQYVSYLRMNEFKRLLQETDKTIKDCVTEIGYCDVPNFLRKFKSIEGMTPGQYRAVNGHNSITVITPPSRN